MTRLLFLPVLVVLAGTPVSAQTPGVPIRHAAADPVDKILKKWDKNSDGLIDKSEYSKKPERFKELDTNKDGKLDKAEIKVWAKEKAERDKAERE